MQILASEHKFTVGPQSAPRRRNKRLSSVRTTALRGKGAAHPRMRGAGFAGPLHCPPVGETRDSAFRGPSYFPAASSSALHDGEQTGCDFPATLRDPMRERKRCLPHMKHDIVEAPNDAAAPKGEPDALLLYRKPSARTVVFASAFVISASLLLRVAWPCRWRLSPAFQQPGRRPVTSGTSPHIHS